MTHMMLDTLAAARSLDEPVMGSTQAGSVTTTIRHTLAEDATTRADSTDFHADLAPMGRHLTWCVFLIAAGLLALATTPDRLLG